MLVETKVIPSKTFANEASLKRGITKALGSDIADNKYFTVRYFIAWTEEGRCYPVFFGQAAIDVGVHFHFNVVG